MDQILRAVHTLGGWPLISTKGDLLRRRVIGLENVAADFGPNANRPATDARRFDAGLVRGAARELVDARPALRAWDEATARFSPLVAEQLQHAEAVGRMIALRRLADSQVEVITQMRRYLTGFDDGIFAAEELRFDTSVRLKPSVPASGLTATQDPVADLRAKALQLARVQAQAKNADAFDELAAASASVAGLGVLVVSGVAALQRSAARGVQLAAYRSALAAEHPVLHRLDLGGLGQQDRRAPLTDAELLGGLQEVFATTWKASQKVRRRVDAAVWDGAYATHPAGPSSGLGVALRNRGMNGGLASLLAGRYGPWAFQRVMADAASDIAGPGQSIVSQAVHDVYQAVDPSLGAEFGEMVALTGALMTLHLVAAPLAVAADIVLAAKGIYEALVAFLKGKAAYECTLDPAKSFGTQPSMLRLALQCAGEVAGGLPGAGKLATTVSILAPLAAGVVP